MADSIETDTVLALRERIHELQRELEEHKQAEHALIKRERHQQEITRLLELDQARLAAVLRHMPVGVWITDPNGRVIGTNEQAERIWAGAPSPLDNIWDYQAYIARGPGSDAPLEPEQYPLAVALRTGETVNTQELDIRRFDGTEGTVMASAAPILDLQGRVAGAVGVNVDISERKRLEEAVRESEARFRTMADGTPIMIWVTDANGRMEFINKAYSEFFGVALEQVQSGTWQVLLHAEDRAGYVDVYMACLKEQRVFQAESRVLRGDGQWRWVASYGQPRFSERGEYLGMAGSSLDITERRQAEEALRESQSMLAEAERVSDAGSWRWNIQTGKLRWSDALYTVYGVNCETFEPSIEAFTDFIHPDDRQLVEQKIEQIRASGAAVDFEFRIVSGTGKIRVLKAIGQVTQFDGAGNPLIVIGANQDITEQKTAEQALRESEAKFHSAFENAAIGYALQTPEGRFVDANSAYCRLLGYSIGELNRLKFSDLLHPEDHAKHTPLVDQLLAGDIPDFVVESRYYRKDGKIVWVRKSCSLVKEASGEPKWMLAFIEDITEQKTAEQARQESENIYRAIGEAIPYGVWVCEPDGRNIYASQSYLDLVGITQQQCSDFGWGDTLHPDDAERTIVAWKECVRTEGVWDIEHRFRGTDGKYHPILARGIPVRDGQGKIICWAGINLDISRLKQVEQDLKTSEERFEVALKNSPMLVYTTDRELRYTWIYNPPLGMEASQIIGKTDEELNDAANVMALVALKRSVLETGVGRRTEIEWRYQGESYYFDVTAEPTRDEKGSITGLTVAAIDITATKLLQQVLLEDRLRIELQRRLLEQREQERLAVAQDIHDGPTQTLASVMLRLDIARERWSDPDLHGELDGIESNIRNAVQELRDIVAELRPALLQLLGLSEALRAYAEDFQAKCPEIILRQEIADDQDQLSIDACLSLFRIYQEALNNIAHHARATRADVRFFFVDGMAILEIQDNGKGMDMLPDLITQTANGHYGMAGMQERAEAVGGTLQLRSTPEQGTNVRATIPIRWEK